MNLSFLQGLPWYLYVVIGFMVLSFIYRKFSGLKSNLGLTKSKWNYSMNNSDIRTAYELLKKLDFLGLEEQVKHMPDDVRFFTLEHIGSQEKSIDIINIWLENEPKNELALLLKGYSLARKAWRVRGHGYSSDIKDSDMQLFREINEEAYQLFSKSVKGNYSVDFYTGVLFTLKAKTVEQSAIEETFKKGVALDPENIALHQAYFQVITPKWGGTEELMQDYISTLKKGTFLYGAIMGRYYRDFSSMVVSNLPRKERKAAKEPVQEFVTWVDTLEDQPMNLHRYPLYEDVLFCLSILNQDKMEEKYKIKVAPYTKW